MKTNVKVVAAPWKLKGAGYILLYKFSNEFIKANRFVSNYLKSIFRGGFGFVMLVNYQETPCGPYKELLFIPGKFAYPGREKRYIITRIFVDTDISTFNGRINWGIPKKTASIQFEKTSNRKERFIFNFSGEKIFEIQLKFGRLKFPVSTRLMPLKLVQELDGQLFFTTPVGKGKGLTAKILDIHSDPGYFPDLNTQKCLMAIKVPVFQIIFPQAHVEKL